MREISFGKDSVFTKKTVQEVLVLFYSFLTKTKLKPRTSQV